MAPPATVTVSFLRRANHSPKQCAGIDAGRAAVGVDRRKNERARAVHVQPAGARIGARAAIARLVGDLVGDGFCLPRARGKDDAAIALDEKTRAEGQTSVSVGAAAGAGID